VVTHKGFPIKHFLSGSTRFVCHSQRCDSLFNDLLGVIQVQLIGIEMLNEPFMIQYAACLKTGQIGDQINERIQLRLQTIPKNSTRRFLTVLTSVMLGC
jgi:hypothetical protein